MTALEAALKVLQEVGKPLHYREITKRIMSTKLWKTGGKTPAATISAQLSSDVKRNGPGSMFRRVGRGVYAVNNERDESRKAGSRVLRTEEPTLYVVRAPRAGQTVSFTEAAELILQSSQGEPMHYRDITRHALERRMLDTTGKTPEATMYAQILTETKRRQARGEPQRFMMLGKGMMSLARWQAKGLAFQVDHANRKARKEILRRLKDLTPTDFEELIGKLLAAIGFQEVEVTARSKDGGIDVRGILVVGEVIRTRLAVQAKKWKRNVQSPVIQQVRGSLGTHDQGLVITTSDFSKGAKKEAQRSDATPVGLMDGEQLVGLLVEHQIGVRRTPLQLIELGEPGNDDQQ